MDRGKCTRCERGLRCETRVRASAFQNKTKNTSSPSLVSLLFLFSKSCTVSLLSISYCIESVAKKMTAAVNLNGSRATRSNQKVNGSEGVKASTAPIAPPPVDGPTVSKSQKESSSKTTTNAPSQEEASTGVTDVASQQQQPASTPPTATTAKEGTETTAKTAGGKESSQPPPQKQGTNRKGGPTSERDSINALLSLGHDLQGSEESEGQSAEDPVSTTIAVPKRPPPQPILPATLAAKPSKKRQKKDHPASRAVPNAQPGYQYPPDFWYWLPPGESVGEWDVLVSNP
jgi:hypothetical protein